MVNSRQTSSVGRQKRWQKRFSDRYGSWAVVTGASAGIGRAIALSLAEAGFNLVLVARRHTALEQMAAAPGPTHSGFADRAGMRLGSALKPEDIAQPILTALGHRSTVLPGFLLKLLVYSLMLLPRSLRVRIMERVMGGLTKHQREMVPGDIREAIR